MLRLLYIALWILLSFSNNFLQSVLTYWNRIFADHFTSGHRLSSKSLIWLFFKSMKSYDFSDSRALIWIRQNVPHVSNQFHLSGIDENFRPGVVHEVEFKTIWLDELSDVGIQILVHLIKVELGFSIRVDKRFALLRIANLSHIVRSSGSKWKIEGYRHDKWVKKKISVNANYSNFHWFISEM